MRIESRTHTPRAIYNVGYRVLMNDIDAKEIADRYLMENWDVLKFDRLEDNKDEIGEQIHEMKHVITKKTQTRATVHYSQKYRGLDVYDSDVVVTVNTEKQMVTFVSSNYKPNISLLDMLPTVSEGAAVDAALKEIGIRPRHVTSLKTKLAVIVKDDKNEYELNDFAIVWVITMSSKINQTTRSLEFIYDAYTGENLRIKNLIYGKYNEQEIWNSDRKVTIFNQISSFNNRMGEKKTNLIRKDMKDPLVFVQANANVFNPNPLATAKANYFDDGYSDNDDKNNAKLQNQLKKVTLKNITLDDCGIYFLSGPYAKVVDFDSPLESEFKQENLNFAYDRSHDAFEAINAYYHIDEMMRYVNDELGINVAPTIYSGGVQFDPHGQNYSDDSAYDRVTQRLSFGEGGVDDAEDAEVVIHFLALGIYDWLTGGKVSSDDGLFFGFGDYLAVSYGRSQNQWTVDDPEYNWVFGWDGHNEFWDGRITNYKGTYPESLTGFPTVDGQIWSTCGLKVWDAIGRIKTDKIMILGISSLGSSSNQEDAANAVVTSARDLNYSNNDISTIQSIFTECGYNIA